MVNFSHLHKSLIHRRKEISSKSCHLLFHVVLRPRLTLFFYCDANETVKAFFSALGGFPPRAEVFSLLVLFVLFYFKCKRCHAATSGVLLTRN